MTLEALHTIITAYLSPDYRYEAEPYTLTDDESRAMVGNKGYSGDREGFHLDICPRFQEGIIETLFIRHDMTPRVIRWYVSLSVQRIQRRMQAQSVTPYLDSVK